MQAGTHSTPLLSSLPSALLSCASFSCVCLLRLNPPIFCLPRLPCLPLSYFAFCCFDRATAKTAREGRIYMAYMFQLQCIREGSRGRSRGRIWRQTLRQRPQWNTAYWLACFLIPPWTSIPGVAPPTVTSTFPHQSLIKRMSHRLTQRMI